MTGLFCELYDKLKGRSWVLLASDYNGCAPNRASLGQAFVVLVFRLGNWD